MNRTPDRPQIQVYGLLDSYLALGNVAANVARILERACGSVALCNYSKSAPADSRWQQAFIGGYHPQRIVFKDLVRLEYAAPRAPVGVYVGTPKGSVDLLALHPVKIALYVCESDRLCESWVREANALDFIFVPSHYCKRAYERSGVRTPIAVMPYGIEAEYRPAPEARRRVQFSFYNTFNFRRRDQRKGTEALIRTFTRTFTSDDDVRLVLRTQHNDELPGLIRRYGGEKTIELMPLRFVATRPYARLFSRFHCTVHPSLAEGFGFIPLQSIACETPVIASHSSALAEYLTNENAMLVRGSGGGSESQGAIDEGDLSAKLRWAVEHWEEERERVRRAAPEMRRRFAWDVVLAPLVEMVRRIAKAPFERSFLNSVRGGL